MKSLVLKILFILSLFLSGGVVLLLDYATAHGREYDIGDKYQCNNQWWEVVFVNAYITRYICDVDPGFNEPDCQSFYVDEGAGTIYCGGNNVYGKDEYSSKLTTPPDPDPCEHEKGLLEEECGGRGFDIDEETCEGSCKPCPEKGTDAGTLIASINQEMPMCLDFCEVTGSIDAAYPPTIKLNDGSYSDELIFRGEYTGEECHVGEEYPKPEQCDDSGAIDQCYAACGGEEGVDFVGCNDDIFVCDCLDIPKADVWLDLGDFLPDDVKEQYPDVFPPENPTDSDGDGTADTEDNDDDDDGVLDQNDSTPTGTRDPNADTDGDGIRDSNDGDIDGDGIMNVNDPTPYGSEIEKDTDGDGISDKNDGDIDGDGVLNVNDATPNGTSEVKTAENTNAMNKKLDGISDSTKQTANNTDKTNDILGKILNKMSGSSGSGDEGDGDDEGSWSGSGAMGGIDTSGAGDALTIEKQRMANNIESLKESVSDVFALNLGTASGLPVLTANIQTFNTTLTIDFNNYSTFFAYLTWLAPLLASISAVFIIFD